MLQFGPYIGPNGPIFSHRFKLDIVAPTGAYNPKNAINPGSNFWQIDPYWSATYWITPKLGVSIRIHYLWNGKNNNPNTAFGPDVSSTQAGQAISINFASDYALTSKIRVGLNGYWFDQELTQKLMAMIFPVDASEL